MTPIRERRWIARFILMVAATIVAPASLALSQSASAPTAAAIAIAPAQVPNDHPTEIPRAARKGERIRVIPIDMLKGDESFDEFRRYLADAIKRHDAQAVYRVVAPDFETHSMDEDLPNLTPFDQFKRTALLESKDPHPVFDYWRTLDDALRFGTVRIGYARLGTVYCGPAFTTSPDEPDDSPDNALLVGDDIPIRIRPASSAPSIASLSWEAIRAPDWPDLDHGYMRIVTRDGRSGWVEGRFVRQHYEPTVCFGREPNGDWSIKAIDVNDD